MTTRRGEDPRPLPSETALRVIMRRLREIMSETGTARSRLDKIVKQIAGVMVTEVCSIYLKRQDGSLELFATEGLNPGAVHSTRMKRGEGLVGRCAELQRHGQRAGGFEPPGVLLPAGDGRGDLPLAAGGADRALAGRCSACSSCRTARRRNTPTRTSRCCRRRRWSSPSISCRAPWPGPARRSSWRSRCRR